MSVVNAVRNKLIQRLFSCVKEDRLYRTKDERHIAPMVVEKQYQQKI